MIILTIFSTVFSGCERDVVASELIGRWQHLGASDEDKATIELLSTGEFTASKLPARLIFGSTDGRRSVSGKGQWNRAKEGGFGAIELNFSDLPDRPGGFRMNVLIDRTRREITLFLWEDEEGGKRFKFHRAD